LFLRFFVPNDFLLLIESKACVRVASGAFFDSLHLCQYEHLPTTQLHSGLGVDGFDSFGIPFSPSTQAMNIPVHWGAIVFSIFQGDTL
jgi:hypothetical protein